MVSTCWTQVGFKVCGYSKARAVHGQVAVQDNDDPLIFHRKSLPGRSFLGSVATNTSCTCLSQPNQQSTAITAAICTGSNHQPLAPITCQWHLITKIATTFHNKPDACLQEKVATGRPVRVPSYLNRNRCAHYLAGKYVPQLCVFNGGVCDGILSRCFCGRQSLCYHGRTLQGPSTCRW